MSAGRHTTLPGQHYCKAHQGNHSHYDPQNCTVCTLVALCKCALEQSARVRPDFADALRAAIAKATEG